MGKENLDTNKDEDNAPQKLWFQTTGNGMTKAGAELITKDAEEERNDPNDR